MTGSRPGTGAPRRTGAASSAGTRSRLSWTAPETPGRGRGASRPVYYVGRLTAHIQGLRPPEDGADPPRQVPRAAGSSDQFRAVLKAFHLSDGLVRITGGVQHRQVREEGPGFPGQFAGRHGVRKPHVRDQKVHGRGLL